MAMTSKPQLPQARAPTSVIKNAAAAPVVFFDNAPTYGHMNGMIQVTLAAGLLVPKTDNTVLVEVVAAGHLRCSVAAAVSLREALDGALKLAATQPFKLAS
jgi:hypothetical protein